MPNTKEKGKLIEVLSKHIPYGYATLCLIAEELMAEGVTFATDNNVGDKWISVNDRLPKKDELVLCIGKRGGMFLGEIHPFLVGRERNEVYCDVPNSRQGRYAIYWMPLPQPPKGE